MGKFTKAFYNRTVRFGLSLTSGQISMKKEKLRPVNFESQTNFANEVYI